jgi:hypothetical protein
VCMYGRRVEMDAGRTWEGREGRIGTLEVEVFGGWV